MFVNRSTLAGSRLRFAIDPGVKLAAMFGGATATEEHNEFVFKQWLGMSKERFNNLRTTGVIYNRLVPKAVPAVRVSQCRLVLAVVAVKRSSVRR